MTKRPAQAKAKRPASEVEPEAEGYPGVGRVLVVIPTYNEIDNLEIIIGRVRERGAVGRHPRRRRQQPRRHR